MAQVQFEAAKFSGAFDAALREHSDAHVASLAAVGMALTGPSVSMGGLCDLFPKIEKTVEGLLAVPFLAWIYPDIVKYAPAIRALLSAFKTIVLPLICPVAPAAAESAPTGGGRRPG